MRKSLSLVLLLNVAAYADWYSVPQNGGSPPTKMTGKTGSWRLARVHDNPYAAYYRDLNNGENLVGAQKELLRLTDPNEHELLHLSFFTAWRANKHDPAYGPSIGTNLGSVGQTTKRALMYFTPEIQSKIENYAPWLQKSADMLGVEGFCGYRPNTGQMIWGYGAKLSVPIDQALAWLSLE